MNYSAVNSIPYIGRFAPSPSGPLHFGSLISALASYLDAKHHNGQWLVRMEDIDPPREEDGAKEKILSSLLAHGLQWDGDIMYQSQRLDKYQEVLEQLDEHTYLCQCGRQRLLELRGVYDSHCLHNPVAQNSTEEVMTSTRIHLGALAPNTLTLAEHYSDLFQGTQTQSLKKEVGDFILRRKDGLFAYQLAVVVDDITQQITHIIRGSDLLSSTPRLRYLNLLIQPFLSASPAQRDTLPIFGHIPVATNKIGQKLSKQHKAKGLDDKQAFDNLCHALTFLKQPLDAHIVDSRDIPSLIRWAIQHWQRTLIPQALSFVVDD